MPRKLRDQLAADPEFKRCLRAGEGCSGRITFEHAMIYAGKQVQERWAIIPLCEHHHLGAGLDKNLNRYLALSRATDAELKKFPKAYALWKQQLNYLAKIYGKEKRIQKGRPTLQGRGNGL